MSKALTWRKAEGRGQRAEGRRWALVGVVLLRFVNALC